jgi:hypothetical protein
MAVDWPPRRGQPEQAPPRQQAAAEVGAMVAEQVRQAIESAERSADDLQRQALDRASVDGEAVERTAAQVLEQIDAIEAKVGKLLQTLRDEVSRTAQQGRRAEVVNEEPPAPGLEGPASEELPPAESRALEHEVAPAQARRRRRFGRRRRPLGCAVCGRAPLANEEDLEGWSGTGKLSVCPDCQHEGWQLPAGARVPYRSTLQDTT